jgi:hypothetical protein
LAGLEQSSPDPGQTQFPDWAWPAVVMEICEDLMSDLLLIGFEKDQRDKK